MKINAQKFPVAPPRNTQSLPSVWLGLGAFLWRSGGLLSLLALPIATVSVHAGTPERVEAMVAQMTLAEKIGQMTQVDSNALRDKSHIAKYFLGSVLSGGGSDPTNNSPQAWLQLATECQAWAGQTRLKIPLLYGVDAVHGHNNVDGAVIFPHNIGLGATHNARLVEAAARVTAEEIAGTGINWAFAPCIAVAQNPHWGRTYESFSDTPELAGELGAAAVRGLQGDHFAAPGSVLACAKHFVGDGGTLGGVDQGNTVGDEAKLRKIHLAPYLPAIKGDVGSIMVSYNSWNGAKMHGHKHLLTDVLKGELGFKGFLVSDWAAIDQLPHDYQGSVEASINAGLDMVMIPNGPGQPNNYEDFIADLTKAVSAGRVPLARIDDAVRRILRAKYELGAFATKPVAPTLTAEIGSAAHRKIARECVQQSMVLLKNESATLPLAKNLKHLLVVGKAADDLGIQCGGWTIGWQGDTGKVTKGGTTILEAIRKTVSPETKVDFATDKVGVEVADAILVVIGELPYAEMKGDRADLRLPAADLALISQAKLRGVPVVTVLLSGRPLILGAGLDQSDAFVAAWLPGTEGQGVADVLFGDYRPTGKLPRAWPKSAEAPAAQASAADQAVFQVGFGLTYAEAWARPVAPLKTASAGR